MALQVASLFGVLSLDDTNFRSGLSSAKTGLSSFGSDLQKAGANVTAISAPIASLFGVATKSAVDFDEAATNTGAVLGYNREQIEDMKLGFREFLGDTRYGGTEIADTFYDIAGGVADTNSHWAILRASVHASQAGNANLQSTTQALISTMNSYSFAADKAGMVSDVLTQIVGKGVGTMDQFAGSLPQVTGLAATLGIPLEDVGASLAFLTTKGATASEAATMLGANMSAIAKPNEIMKTALAELGFTSGETAIKQLGLVGALQALSNTTTAQDEGITALLGTQEAWRGQVALMGSDYAGFRDTFVSTMDGVTARAEEVQMGSAAAQFDMLTGEIDKLSIVTGEALIPALLNIVDQVKPVIGQVVMWITQNPELVAQIGMLAGAGVLLGGGLFVLGTIFTGVSTVVGVLTGAFVWLLSPLGLVTVGVASLLFWLNGAYPGGLSQLFLDAATSAQQLAQIFLTVFGPAIQTVRDGIVGLVTGLIDAINKFSELIGLSGANERSGVARTAANTAGRILGQRANGGPVMAGGAYIVGERGPELFTPGSSGYVHSNDSMGGVQISGGIQIYANTTAGGYAAMDGALARARARGY